MTRTSLALLAGLAAVGCRGAARADRAARDSTAYPDSANQAARADTTGAAVNGVNDSLLDSEIALYVVTANQLDSLGGADAHHRASTPAVRQFAERMMRDHGAANRRAAPISHRLNPQPASAESNEIRRLRQGATDARTELARDSGRAFDQAYIDHEVEDHQKLLDKIDKELLPRTRDPQLRNLLQDMRGTVSQHLLIAKQLKDALAHG